MGRIVRTLLKVPAVRRVMVRLANAEDGLANQKASLDQLDARLERFNADQAAHHALTARMSEKLEEAADFQSHVATYGQFRQQRTQLDLLDSAVQTQQAQIDALLAQVRQLGEDNDRSNALLAEVSQHLPPAQRANLEATLHGQQLQLGALNSTVNAQQMQLAALNDVVHRLDPRPDGRILKRIQAEEPVAESEGSLRTLLTERDQEIRRLRVSHGRSFEELRALGAAGGGAAYRFEELVAIRDGSATAATVPPLVFIHLPKAGGTTLNHILMKNYRFRCDAYGPDFFPRYYPDEFVSLVQPPNYDDTRRPVFFTGHIDLANELLHHMPVRYLAITMLRDPVERVVSHFRYHSTRDDSPLCAEIKAGLRLPEYYRKFQTALPPQCAVFAPGQGDASSALANLESRVSLFGIQERFREFTTLLGSLLGLPDIGYRPLNVTADNAVDVPQDQIVELRSLLAEDVTFYDNACKLYRSRMESLASGSATHPWTRFYAA